MSNVIEVRGLCKRFGAHKVLEDVSFDVASGETLALIGPSGSGKTTLIRCVNRLEVPDEGSVTILGEEIGAKNEVRVRRHLGMVFQHFNLFPHMTAAENVAAGPRYVLKRPGSECDEVAGRMLNRVHLGHKANVYPAHLSGGEKQRVGIARALAMEPSAILFDEVTSSLDPELVGHVLLVMRELAAEGMTMIVVTHEMDFARDVANRVIFMDDGRLVEVDSPEVIFTKPREPRTRQFLDAVLNRSVYPKDA